MKLSNLQNSLSRWTEFVKKHPFWILSFYVPLTLLSLYFCLTRLGINTDLSDMISEKLAFHHRWKEYKSEFPNLDHTFLVVVNGKSFQATQEASDWLVSQLKQDKKHFQSASWLTGGRFFDRHFFLYQSPTEVKKTTEHLQSLQPLFLSFSKRPDTKGFFSSLAYAASEPSIDPFLNQLTAVLENKKKRLDYGKLFFGSRPVEQLIEIKPVLDYSRLMPAQKPLQALHDLIHGYTVQHSTQASFGVTGSAALGYEEMKSVSQSAGWSAILSFILVSLILVWAIRSFRLIGLTLMNLVVGLILTAGFAAVAVGHLNLISVAFAVLFIGLGVDYSIHLALRYRDLIAEGKQHSEALSISISQTGSSLFVCTLTTAVGFYAFVPTAYAGVSELGIISGTGMFINLLVHLTLFPAALSLAPLRSKHLKTLKSSYAGQISGFAYRHSRIVKISTGALFLICIPLALQVKFDPNPLNLQDPNTEAYKVYRKLLLETKQSPWTIKIVEANQEKTKALIARLKKISDVSKVVSIDSYVPNDQKEKLQHLKALSLSPLKENQPPFATSASMVEREKQAFVKQLDLKIKETTNEIHKKSLKNLKQAVLQSENSPKFFNQAIISPTKNFYQFLTAALSPAQIQVRSLPRDIRDRYISSNGKYRIEVFPKADLMKMKNMRAFSNAVLAVAPQATDDPVTLPLTGDAVVRAFIEAAIIAFVLITILLFFLTRSLKDSIYVLLPLIFSAVLVKALMSLFGASFNFANIIVLPLLLGIGVDSGIHLIHRFRTTGEEAIEGSTSRGIFFSALTTIASFGTLCISTHRGMASLGVLLTFGTLVVMLSTLMILPAIVKEPKRAELRKVA